MRKWLLYVCKNLFVLINTAVLPNAVFLVSLCILLKQNSYDFGVLFDKHKQNLFRQIP